MRVNTNGKRVDAWLVYKCTDCDDTWNRPVLERRPVQAIDPEFLASLGANDAAVARRLAFDVEGLRRRADRVAEFDDALVIKRVLSGDATSARQLDILCAVPEPVGLRVDRLLANELGLSRSSVQRLEASGALVASPKGARVRRAVRDGMRLLITSRDVPALQMLTDIQFRHPDRSAKRGVEGPFMLRGTKKGPSTTPRYARLRSG
ncbi:MAG: DUF1062 domain-containing protein [Alphaproteobacteria bacterium]|nr:DUF1062 domain-containing protein [Alphaproteobacteria bacterium]